MDEDTKVKILIWVMVLAVVGLGAFIFFSQDITPGTYQYVHGMNTYDIQQIGTKEKGGITYRIKIFINDDPSPKYINTRYEPKHMEGLKINPDVKKDILTKKEIFIAINPNAGLTGKTTIAALEIDKFIDNSYLFGIPVKSAFTEEFAGAEGYEIKTCDDVTEETGIIWLKLGEETVIKDEKGCVILEAETEEELIRLSNGLAFYLMGMIG